MKIERSIFLVVLLGLCLFIAVNITFASIATENYKENIIVNAELKNSTSEGVFKCNIIDNSYIEIARYTGEDSVVEIPSTIAGLPVESIGSAAFYGYKFLNTVKIPDTVKTIGEMAFSECVSLQEVVIGSAVTSIGDSAFYKCGALENIEIPNSVKTIGSSAFYWCSALKSAVIGNGTTTIGQDAFCFCGNLKNLIIGSSVTKIGTGAFKFCNSLTEVKIGNNVTSIGDSAFFGADNIVICGIKGSYVESYAKANEIPFVAMSENENKFDIISGSGYSIDEENTALIGVSEQTCLEMLISNFRNNNIAVLDANGNVITDKNVFIGTGCSVILVDENGNIIESVAVVVEGDITGDAIVNSRDIALVQKHILQINLLSGAYLLAADVVNDGTVNSRDIAQIQKKLCDRKQISYKLY